VSWYIVIRHGEEAMLDVLLESRAPRTRRVGSTIASALLHAGLIAGAVALTLPAPVDGKPVPRPPDVVWVDTWPTPPLTPPRAPRHDATPSTAPGPLPIISAPDVVPDRLPPIDAGPSIPPDEVVIGSHGVRTDSPLGIATGTPLGSGSAIDERLVDRAPRLAGRVIEPRYPASLREAGIQGRVVVQFVVDTVGRAELDELQVVETPHPQFVESVRAALAHYRFTVGEAAGRKVRTRVQMPFEFTLKP
jgi:periplasmic protein TonB